MPTAKKPYLSLKTSGGTYKLRFTVNAISDFEEFWGGGISELDEKFNSNTFRMKDIRLLMWAALQHHHSDEVTTERYAGDVIEDAGGLNKSMEPLMNAFSDAFPVAEEDEASENGSGDPKESAQTGAKSSGEESGQG